MELGFYAYDVGPAKMLQTVADTATGMGHETVVVPKQKDGGWREYLPKLKECDFVCIAFSSYKFVDGKRVPVLEEIEMVNALPFNDRLGCVPCVLIEDLPNMSLRHAALEHLSPRALAAAIVAMPQQYEATGNSKGICYKNVAYLGPPPHWQASYESMKSGKPIDSFLKMRGGAIDATMEMVPVEPTDVTVFYVGGKDPLYDLRILTRLAHIGSCKFGDRFVLVFKTHPGEKNFRAQSPEKFDQRDRFLGACGAWIARINPDWSVPELVKSVSMTVFSAGNTDSVVAAYARMPGIYYYTDELVKNLQSMGISDGRWFVPELKGLIEAHNDDELAVAMKILLTEHGVASLKRQQAENFKLPKSWDTASGIVGYLQTLASK